MNLTPQEKAIGKENFQSAIGVTRRDFLKQGIAAGAVSGAGLGAMYFHYDKSISSPLRVGVIGTGDEGGVLLGAITPSYLQVVAIADIRPYNIHRAFHGDHSSESALKARCGLMTKYGWKSEDEARKHVKVYNDDYHTLLENSEVEAVIIALPLWLHDIVAIEAMKAGKHVLTEKLMAHSVHQCKEMARVAKDTGKLLVTGHQRHYSILYDNAVFSIKNGLIGDIHHIRAQWHRDNLPGNDSWQQPLPDDKMETALKKAQKDLEKAKGGEIDALTKKVEQLKWQYEDRLVKAENYGYKSMKINNGYAYERTALEELIRWRLWNRTGGGLMAELGSHQLDASGIFLAAMNDGEKALPLTVNAMGGRHIFPLDRDCEDHVYCIYEFPGKDYKNDKNSKVGVTYSSINGNGFGGYGEIVMGTRGTMILEREQEVMLFKGSSPSTSVTVSQGKGGPTLDTTASGGGEAAAVGKAALESGPASRGYTEEMEHWAFCIRNPDTEYSTPRCHPKIALGDAVIALVTNIAIREERRIEFNPAWFDIDSDETPEGVKPDISRYA